MVLLAVISACTEHATSTGPSPFKPATIAIRPNYVLTNGSVADFAPIHRIRLTARDVATNAIIETETISVSPDAEAWTVSFEIGTAAGTQQVIVTIELINVGPGGVETVEWSGVTAPFTLTAGETVVQDADIFPGPLSNLQVTGITLANVPATLAEGSFADLRADVTPSGIAARVFWSSSNTAVLNVDENGRVQALAPGTARVTADAGPHSAFADIVVRARPARVEITPASLQLEFIGTEATATARVLDARNVEITGFEIVWTSSNDQVVAHLGGGRFRAVGPGTATISAAVTGQPTLTASIPATVTLTVAAVHVTPPSTTLEAHGATVQLTAVAEDSRGTPLPLLAITWTSSDASVATVDASGLVTAVDDGTTTITASAGTISGTATVNVSRAIHDVAIAEGDAQHGEVGAPLALAPAIRVVDVAGHPLPNIEVLFVASGDGSVAAATVRTDANGIAATTWTLATLPGANTLTATVGRFSLQFTATGVPGAPHSIIAISGDGQTGPVSTELPDPLVVEVRDRFENLVGGATVTFTPDEGGSASPAEVVTDVNGRASTRWTLGSQTGEQQMRAQVGDVEALFFTATATGDGVTPADLHIFAGNNQTALPGHAVATQPTVRVLGSDDNPMAGVEVTFTVTGGLGSVNHATVITGEGGLASVIWTLGDEPGANTLEAAVTGLEPVTFTATAQTSDAEPAFIAIFAGDGQNAVAGQAVAIAPAVRVFDASEQPLAGVTVVFEVASGGGSLTGATAVSNSDGVAAAGSWTLGATPGPNTVTATVEGVEPVTFTATGTTSAPTILLSLAAGHTNVAVSFTAPLVVTLNTPAPAGGVVVTVTSSNTLKLTVASPGTVTIPAGSTQGTINLEGAEAGTATVTATADGHITGELAVTVSLRLISLPVTLNIPFGNTASLPIQLAEPAPAGGVTVTLTSANESIIHVVTPTVNIPAGATLASATVEGILPGSANVTATAPSYIGGSSNVVAQANLDIVQSGLTINASFGGSFTLQLRSNNNAIAAPAGGVTVSLTARDPACVAVAASTTIPQGLTQVSVPVSYGGSATLSCFTRVVATATNIAPDSVGINVNPTPVISLNPVTIGDKLQRSHNFFLGASNHGGVTVTLTSGDSETLRIAPDTRTEGSSTLQIFVPNGSSFGSFTLQSDGGTGTVQVTASAPGFTSVTTNMTIAQAAIDISGLPANLTTLTADDPFSVRIGIANAGGNFLTELQEVRFGGPAIDVNVQSSDPDVVAIVTNAGAGRSGTASILPGFSSTNASVANGGFDARATGAGSAVVTTTGVNLIPTTSAGTINVTVTAPPLTPSNTSPVGAGLQISQFISLGTSTHGGTTVRVTSANPERLLVSTSSSTPGSAFVDVSLLNGNSGFSVFLQAIEGAPVNVGITASAPGFADGSRTVAIVSAALDIVSLSTSTTTANADDNFQARVGIANANGQFLTELQSVRPGGPGIPITFTTSSPTVATLVTEAGAGASRTITLTSGSSTPGSVASGGVALRPLQAGSTVITASSPDVITTSNSVTTVNVTGSNITLSAVTVGAGLMRSSSGALSGGNHGGVTVRLTSADPSKLLVSANTITAGTEFVDIPITDGNTFFSFVVHGLENQVGTVALNATATGFSDGSSNMSVVQPGLDISGLNASTNTLASDDPFTVRIGIPFGTSGFLSELQARRAGAAPLAVTVTSSNPAGQLVTTAGASASRTVEITAQNVQTPTSVATGGVAFRPFTAGTTVVTAAIPGFLVMTGGEVTVVVTAPPISLNSLTVGSGLQRQTNGTLGSGNHGGITVHLTSSNSSVALLSPNANTPGQASIDVVLADGQTNISYFVAGVEGATGQVQILATAPGFTDGTATATIVQPALDISSLSNGTTVITGPDVFTVRIGIGNATNLTELQSVRAGGTPLAVTVTTSNAGVARLATSSQTGTTVGLTIPVLASATPGTLATGGAQLEPLSSGSTTVAASIPGFFQTTAGVVQVNVAPATVTVSSTTVGAGLQRTNTVLLNGSAHGGVVVRLTSADPSKLLLAVNTLDAGAPFIDVTLNNGIASVSFWVHGVESTTGVVAIQGTTTGFVSGQANTSVVQPAMDIVGLPSSIGSGNADDVFQIRVGIPNNLDTGLNELQIVRVGSSLTATITSSNPAVGTLVTSAQTAASVTATIAALANATPGSVATGGVAFDPLTVGSTVVGVTIPGFKVLPSSSQTVTVN